MRVPTGIASITLRTRALGSVRVQGNGEEGITDGVPMSRTRKDTQSVSLGERVIVRVVQTMRPLKTHVIMITMESRKKV
jgi:hypothetical protein